MEERIRILIDCSFVKYPFMGMGIYTMGLAKELSLRPELNASILIRDKYKHSVKGALGCNVNFISIGFFDKLIEKISFFISLKAPYKCKILRSKFKVVLSPYLFKNMILFKEIPCQIAVIHDLQGIKLKIMDGDHEAVEIEKKVLSKIIGHIQTIVSISKSTQKDLLSMFGRDSYVIYNSYPNYIDGKIVKSQKIDRLENKRYILDNNSFKKYKNALRLISAFSKVSDKIPNYILYLKGGTDTLMEEQLLREKAKELRISDKVIIDASSRTEGEMEFLYSNADLVVSPSLMEGFGFAPIEGIMHRRPVIISKTDTLVETTFGLVPQFDPYSEDDMAEMILHEIENPPSAEELEKRANFIGQKYDRKEQISLFVNLIKKNTK